MFHSFEASEALHDAIKIAEKELKNQTLAFEVRQQLVKDYPGSDEAPEALFDMAEYIEKSGDTAQAKKLYHQLIEQYPSEKSLVRKARERI
jgi:TolA-binding protein